MRDSFATEVEMVRTEIPLGKKGQREKSEYIFSFFFFNNSRKDITNVVICCICRNLNALRQMVLKLLFPHWNRIGL